MAIIIRCSKASIAPVLFLNVFPANTSIIQISEISSVFTIPIAAYAFKLRIPFTGTAVFLFFASYAIIQNIHHSPLLICFFCPTSSCIHFLWNSTFNFCLKPLTTITALISHLCHIFHTFFLSTQSTFHSEAHQYTISIHEPPYNNRNSGSTHYWLLHTISQFL